jgi:hypothetical protein
VKNDGKKTQAREVLVAGVPVRVYFDGEGRPLSATALLNNAEDREHERTVALAATIALDAARRAAKKKQRNGSSAGAAAESAKSRAKRARKHWTNDWFAKALAADPKLGRTRLAQQARRLAAAAGIELDKRNEITDDRARQFLNRQRHRSS